MSGNNDKTVAGDPTRRRQLVSYIAPGAPATRRPADGDEPFLRPEVGFTPKWYRERLGIDFGQAWHCDPACRREAILAMRAELRRRFPATRIGGIDRPDRPLDLLTGMHGACATAALFGLPIVYRADDWPDCERRYLTDEQVDRMEPPDLDRSAMMHDILRQAEWIAAREGRVEGYINWQGVLNTAQRLRGEMVFADMMDSPARAGRLFDCICQTMIDAVGRLHRRQRETGVNPGFITVSNCVVNMISPQSYASLLLPRDRRIAEAFGCIGIHNCAWRADPYLDSYAAMPGVGYIDMGLASDLPRARRLFPHARRAVMYTPMDLARKSPEAVRDDVARIAREMGPCDIVVADIEAGTPDDRVRLLLDACEHEGERVSP